MFSHTNAHKQLTRFRQTRVDTRAHTDLRYTLHTPGKRIQSVAGIKETARRSLLAKETYLLNKRDLYKIKRDLFPTILSLSFLMSRFLNGRN